MKRRILAAVLALILAFSLGACAAETPPPEETPTPTATPTPIPETNLGRWLSRAETRYNMKYDDFNAYWCLLCDEYFGEDMHTLLNGLAACENTAYSLDNQNKEIAAKRAEYEKRGGKDWSFKITEHTETPLGQQACVNFADELKSVHDLICALTDKAQYWSDYGWADFAQSLGCDVDTAKAIVNSYWVIASSCVDVEVTSAAAIELTVEFSDGSTVKDSTTLYEINGEYVSTELIDAASMLIQLIYF